MKKNKQVQTLHKSSEKMYATEARRKLIKSITTTLKWGLIGLTSTYGFNINKYPHIKEVLLGFFYSTLALLLWEFSIGIFVHT